MAKKILKSLLHSLALLFLHLVYFNLSWSFPLEYEMMMMMNKTESFLGGHGRFDKKDYLFINTGYDQKIIKTETEYSDTGTIAIADRQLLSQFFEKIAASGNQHKYILCDLLFDLPSPDDTAFISSINRVNKIIIPIEYDKKSHQFKKLVVNVKAAQADYISYEGSVSKVRLFAKESKTKTLPLAMYESCDSIHTKVTGWGMFYKSSYIPESIYPRYFFDRKTMKDHELRLKNVIDMLTINEKLFYESALKGKIIIIGDFNKDNHSTFIGQMPGSLVLFNTYLTLEAGYQKLGWGWFIFAIFSFAALCYLEFIYKKGSVSVINRSWRKLFLHLLGISGWCFFISFLSGFVFGVHITIIPVVIYLELFRYVNKIIHFKQHV